MQSLFTCNNRSVRTDLMHHKSSILELIYNLERESLKTRNQLLNEYRFYQPESSSNMNKVEYQLQLKQNKIVLDFIGHSISLLKVNPSLSWMYLLNEFYLKMTKEDENFLSNSLILLNKSLQICRHETMDFFKNLKEIISVPILLSDAIMENYTEYFTTLLKGQKNITGVVPLFSNYFDCPEALCALIHWLFDKGLNQNEILKTGILHQFLSFNLSFLHTQNSPVFTFYQLLSQSDNGQKLCELAKNTRCEERGFEQYSLCGEVKNELTNVSLQIPLIEITANQGNLASLFSIFSNSLLIGILKDGYLNQNGFTKELEKFFNQMLSRNELIFFCKFMRKRKPSNAS